MHALEFMAQWGSREPKQVACDLQAGRRDYLYRSGGEACEQCRENRGVRTRRYALVDIDGRDLRAAASELFLEERPAVGAFDDQYAAACRMFETRVLKESFRVESST